MSPTPTCKACTMKNADDRYWSRIKRIPLEPVRDSDDAQSVMCRAQDGTPVLVPRPESFETEREMEATLDLLEMLYSPRMN